MCVCASMCTLWDVSEEDLSGTRNDVCSGAAELGHREVDRERESEREKKTGRENTDSDRIQRMEELCVFTLPCKSHHFHWGVSSADVKLYLSLFLRVHAPQRALVYGS